MAVQITFRGVTIFDLATTGAGYVPAEGGAIGRTVKFDQPAIGDGEFVKVLGAHGADVTIKMTHRVALDGLDAHRAAFEALTGGARGTLQTPEASFTNCIVASEGLSFGVPRIKVNDAGTKFWLQDVTIRFRRSK